MISKTTQMINICSTDNKKAPTKDVHCRSTSISSTLQTHNINLLFTYSFTGSSTKNDKLTFSGSPWSKCVVCCDVLSSVQHRWLALVRGTPAPSQRDPVTRHTDSSHPCTDSRKLLHWKQVINLLINVMLVVCHIIEWLDLWTQHDKHLHNAWHLS